MAFEYEYEWRADGSVVGSLQSLNLSGLAGKNVSGRVRARNAGTAWSAWVSATGGGIVTPSISPPVNIQIPSIVGLLSIGSERVLDIGVWSGQVHKMEIRLTQENPSKVLIDWTEVNGESSGVIDEDVGGILTLSVRASNSSGSTISNSLPFGPIEPAGDQFVIGLVFNASTSFNPTPIGSLVNYTLVSPNPASNQYSTENGWGFVGTFAATTTPNFNSDTKADVRQRGRWASNLQPMQLGFRLDLPGPGRYLVHLSYASGGAVVPNLQIRDGADHTAPILMTLNPSGLTVAGNTQAMDAASNVTNVADWTAASEYGGQPMQIEVSGDSVWIGRPATGTSLALNYIAFVRMA